MSGRWLYAGPRAGLLIPEARQWRYHAEAGVITEHRPNREPRRVAAAGEIVRACIAPGQMMPRNTLLAPSIGPTELDQLLVIRSESSVLLAVPLVLLAPGSETTGEQQRAASGVKAFVAELGLPLERADQNDAAALVGAAFETGPLKTGLTRRGWLHALGALGIALSIIVAVVLGSRDGAFSYEHPVPLGIGTALVVALTFDLLRQRRRFSSTLRPPEPEDRVALTGGTPGAGGGRPSHLQIGADDILLSAGVAEQWVAGPRRGGATRCIVSPDGLSFERDGNVVLQAGGSQWDVDAAQRACRAAGLEVRMDREPRALKQAPPAILTFFGQGPVLGNGGQLTPLVCGIGGATIGVFSGLDPDRSYGWYGALLATLCFASSAAVVLAAWQRRRSLGSTGVTG